MIAKKMATAAVLLAAFAGHAGFGQPAYMCLFKMSDIGGGVYCRLRPQVHGGRLYCSQGTLTYFNPSVPECYPGNPGGGGGGTVTPIPPPSGNGLPSGSAWYILHLRNPGEAFGDPETSDEVLGKIHRTLSGFSCWRSEDAYNNACYDFYGRGSDKVKLMLRDIDRRVDRVYGPAGNFPHEHLHWNWVKAPK